MNGRNYLLKINRSVITTMTVNHDPQSIVGFHPDGSPVQTQLSITFKELEYVTSNDKTSKSRSIQAAAIHKQSQVERREQVTRKNASYSRTHPNMT